MSHVCVSRLLKKFTLNSRQGTIAIAAIEDVASISILLITRHIRVGFVYNKCREIELYSPGKTQRKIHNIHTFKKRKETKVELRVSSFLGISQI